MTDGNLGEEKRGIENSDDTKLMLPDEICKCFVM